MTDERAAYYLRRLIKGISEIHTSKINDINLYRWQEYSEILTDSLWIINKEILREPITLAIGEISYLKFLINFYKGTPSQEIGC